MDALAGLLDGPRARHAFLMRCVLEPPWSIRVQDQAPLSLTAMLRGHAWVTTVDGRPERLDAGDMMINRGPEPYTVADHDRPVGQPMAVIQPGGRCFTPDGVRLAEEMSLGAAGADLG